MAYTTSNDYKHQLYETDERIYSCSMTINGTLIPQEQIETITISDPIINDDDDYFRLGTFISKKLEIHFKNLDNLNIKAGDELYLSISLGIGDTSEEIPIGYFIIDDLAEDYHKSNNIVCYDYGVKMLSNCDFSGIYTEQNPTATYLEILQYICNMYDFQLGSYPTINNDVLTSQYDSTFSAKKWVSYIAEAFGGNVKIGREKVDGKPVLNIIPLKQTPVLTIDGLGSKDLELGEAYQLTRVVYDNVGILYASGTETGNTMVLRQDNPLINSQAIVDNIYTLNANFTTYSMDIEMFGDVSLDAYDTLTITLDENSYNVLNNCTLTYSQGSILSKISSKIPTKQQEITTNVYGNDLENKVNRVYTEVDNIKGEIRLVSSNTYTKEEIQDIASGNFDDVEVSYVANEMGTFTDEGFRISKTDGSDPSVIISDTSTLFNEEGMKVSKVEDGQVQPDSILFAGYVNENNEEYSGDYLAQSIVASQNIVVKEFAVFGDYSRIQDFDQDGIHKTGMFPIGR